MQRPLLRLTLAGFAAISLSSVAWSFSSGPPNGVTGAPGQSTCAQIGCHSSFPLNSGSGNLSVTYSPTNFVPGDTLDITVNIAQPGQTRWGFEATVLDHTGQPVGEILVTDPLRTQSSVDLGGTTYIKHTALGTDLGTPDAGPGWNFRWVAPSAGADIAATFWVAGNAANGNGFSTGDFIYTDSATALYFNECALNTGDANANGSIAASDIIYLVGYVFKGGTMPIPCAAVGDANCDGSVAASDIIYLVGFVFKGGPPPCNVCSLIPGTWTCP